ncbi:hypothetical protein T07_12947 [Trichinella nelsoni]|uniref:Uncharacterized protein n=1 Tax=Trichinella nelsoni TaxID=6336 RepID=A0A0V0RFL1_9BILA|nr:hypothetical protein T07_12947 [Trichinella nelsoni]
MNGGDSVTRSAGKSPIRSRWGCASTLRHIGHERMTFFVAFLAVMIQNLVLMATRLYHRVIVWEDDWMFGLWRQSGSPQTSAHP